MKKLLIFCMAVLFFSVSNAGIKERLAERLPAINKLKTNLVIGEDNKGFLAVKGNISATDKKIVDAENADRKKIYEMLAKKNGVSVEKIQTRRAAQIADRSKKGIWLQNPAGKWYKK